MDSLDTAWHFQGDDVFGVEAVMDHAKNGARDQLEMSVGDVISITDVYKSEFYAWRGYMLGYNTRTKRRPGYFPIYKTKRLYKSFDFPTYPMVKL